MNKKLLKELQLQAGGAHYPDINPQMQEAFARMIVNECLDAVDDADLRDLIKTTFDRSQADGAIHAIKKSIINRFEMSINELHNKRVPY